MSTETLDVMRRAVEEEHEAFRAHERAFTLLLVVAYGFIGWCLWWFWSVSQGVGIPE